MASDNEASCASDPNFAVICSFLECFGKSCGIIYPDIARLQEMIENMQEVPQQLVDLHIKLLRKTRKTVSAEKWERALVKFCHTYSNQDGWELERFGYKKARIAVKLRLLKVLLETQFDLNQKFKNEVNKLAADELRVEPLGKDKSGLAYWCQLDEECNIRVYREDLDEENWELVAKDREGVASLIGSLSNGEAEPIPINEDSNSLEISEKPIIDTGQITTSPSLEEEEPIQENGIHNDNLEEKEEQKDDLEDELEDELDDDQEQDDAIAEQESAEVDNDEDDIDEDEDITNDESSKQNTEEDDCLEVAQDMVKECSVQPDQSVSTTKMTNGSVDTSTEKVYEKVILPEETTALHIPDSKSLETVKSADLTKPNSIKNSGHESVPLKSIETPVITSPLKLVNISELKHVQEEKNTNHITLPISTPISVPKKHNTTEETTESVMKSLEKLSGKGNLSFTPADITSGHNKLSVKPIDQLAANLVRMQSEKLEKPSGTKSLEKIAENLARSGNMLNSIVNGEDDRLPQDLCPRSQPEKPGVLRGRRGMDLSTSPRGWESTNEQSSPMDFSGMDLSSRKFNKSMDLPAPGYRPQNFQQREMDLSTKKSSKSDVQNLSYDARAVMMRNHAMVADLSKRQMPFTAYEMSSAPYHTTPRLPPKDEHRLPSYALLPDPSKITALRMGPTSIKRPLEGDDAQPDILKRIRADVIPIRGSIDKRTMINNSWREETSEAIEEPLMMVHGEGSGSDCDAVNPGLGEPTEEPVMFFYGEGSGVECETGNPGDDTPSDNKESNQSKSEADSATATLPSSEMLNEENLIKEVSTASMEANINSVKLNRNFVQSNVNVHDSQIVGSTQEKPKFKPTLGVQIIPKSTTGSIKRLSRWDVGKPAQKNECDSSIISNEEDISQKEQYFPKESTSDQKCSNNDERTLQTSEHSSVSKVNFECLSSTDNLSEKVNASSFNEVSMLDQNNIESNITDTTDSNLKKLKEDSKLLETVQCDSSISSCQADTSEVFESRTNAVLAPYSSISEKISTNVSDSSSIVTQNSEFLHKVDNECKPKSTSPPRFFFGPNCISYTSKSVDLENQSDQVVTTSVQCKSDTLQYECVSSSKPSEDTLLSYKSEEFDVTQTNNNSLKASSFDSHNIYCPDDKKDVEKLEGSSHTWNSNEIMEESINNAIDVPRTMPDDENLQSSPMPESVYTDSKEPEESTTTKLEKSETTSIISQSFITNNVNISLNAAESLSNSPDLQHKQKMLIDNDMKTECMEYNKDTTDQLRSIDDKYYESTSSPQNVNLNISDNKQDYTEPLSIYSENEAEYKSSKEEISYKDMGETKSDPTTNTCVTPCNKDQDQNVQMESNNVQECANEDNTGNIVESTDLVSSGNFQEVHSSAGVQEIDRVSDDFQALKKDETDLSRESYDKHSDKNDNSSEFDMQEEQSMDTDTEKMKGQFSSDADSMSVNYDKNSERNDTLSDLGVQDEGSGDSEEIKEKHLSNSFAKTNASEDIPESDLVDNATVSSSACVQEYNNKESFASVISSSDESSVQNIFLQSNSNIPIAPQQIDNTFSAKTSTSAFNILPPIVPNISIMKSTETNNVSSLKEINSSTVDQSVNEYADDVSENPSSCIDQDSNEDMIIDDRMSESNESSKEVEEISSNCDKVVTLLDSEKSAVSNDNLLGDQNRVQENLTNILDISSVVSDKESTFSVTTQAIEQEDSTKEIEDKESSSVQITDSHVEKCEMAINNLSSEDPKITLKEDAGNSEKQDIVQNEVSSVSKESEENSTIVNKQSLVANYDSNDSNDDGSDDVFEADTLEEYEPVDIPNCSLEEHQINDDKVIEDTNFEKECISVKNDTLDEPQKLVHCKEEVESNIQTETDEVLVNNEIENKKETFNVNTEEVSDIFSKKNTEVSYECNDIKCSDVGKTEKSINLSNKGEYEKDIELHNITPLDNSKKLNNTAPLVLSALSDHSRLETFINDKTQAEFQVSSNQIVKEYVNNTPNNKSILDETIITKLQSESKASTQSVQDVDNSVLEKLNTNKTMDNTENTTNLIQVQESSSSDDINHQQTNILGHTVGIMNQQIAENATEESEVTDTKQMTLNVAETLPKLQQYQGLKVDDLEDESEKHNIEVKTHNYIDNSLNETSGVEAFNQSTTKISMIKLDNDIKQVSQSYETHSLVQLNDSNLSDNINLTNSISNKPTVSYDVSDDQSKQTEFINISNTHKDNIYSNSILNIQNTIAASTGQEEIFEKKEEFSGIMRNEFKKEGNKRASDTSEIEDVPPLKSKPPYTKPFTENLFTDMKYNSKSETKVETVIEKTELKLEDNTLIKVNDSLMIPPITDYNAVIGNIQVEDNFRNIISQDSLDVKDKNEPSEIESMEVKTVEVTSDDSMGADNENVFDVPSEEPDPLACTEDDALKGLNMSINEDGGNEKIGIRVKSVSELVYDGWKLDGTETPKVSRKRRNSAQDSNSEGLADKLEEEEEMMGGKRIKLRAKRIPDKQLRKSVEESRIVTISSEDEAVKSKIAEENKEGNDEVTITRSTPMGRKSRGRPRGRRRRGCRGGGRSRPKHAEVTVNQISEESPNIHIEETPTNVSSIETTPPSSQKKRKKRKMVLGLEIGRDIAPEEQDGALLGETPVRQSRRIAQLKIKEAADRRRIEEETLPDVKEKKETSTDKKKRRKQKNESEDEVVIKEVDKEMKSKIKRKKRKKKKMLAKFNEANPWQSSSGSSTDNDIENEDEEEEEEIETEGSLLFKSDHEFSPESDLEKDQESEPLRRARTAQKAQSDVEEADDEYACQKCSKADHPEWILLCDSCDKGWHCSCLRPALMLIPEGDWFCPPCQHNLLVSKLRESLKTYDQLSKRHENEVLRKKRLAFVGISLDNVLHKNEAQRLKDSKESSQESENESSSEQSSSSSSSETSSSEESEPVYQLRERRCANTYKFNEYDDMINAAIQDDVEAVQGAGNQGRGKDIATIVNAEKDEAQLHQQTEALQMKDIDEDKNDAEQKSEKESDEEYKLEKEEVDEEDEERKRVAKRLLARRKHRKLNSLDISSEDDPESDEDFKGTSSEDEEDFDDHMTSSDESSFTDSRRRGRRGEPRPVRRSTRARITHYDPDFINDDSDDSDRPKRKKSRSMWENTESEDSDNSWRQRKKKSRTIPTSRYRTTSKVKSKKKKKRKRIIESDNQSDNEEEDEARVNDNCTSENMENMIHESEEVVPKSENVENITNLENPENPENAHNIGDIKPETLENVVANTNVSIPSQLDEIAAQKRKKENTPRQKKAPTIRRKIIYGGLPDDNYKQEEEEILDRRSRRRGRKVNYQEAMATDSEEELKKAIRKTVESEDEFVVNEADDMVEDAEKDSDSDIYTPKKDATKFKNKSPKSKKPRKSKSPAAKRKSIDGTPKPRKKPGPKPGSKNKARKEKLLMGSVIRSTDGLDDKDVLSQVMDNPMGDLASKIDDGLPDNVGLTGTTMSVASSFTGDVPEGSLGGLGPGELADLDDEQLEQIMMEDEEYGRRQLELAAIEIAKKKKKEEREAKKLEKARLKALEILAAERQRDPNAPEGTDGEAPKKKKRGRRSKAEIIAEQMRRGGAPTLGSPGLANTSPGVMAANSGTMLGLDVASNVSPNINPSLPTVITPETERTPEGLVPMMTGPDGQLFNPDGTPMKQKRRGRGKGKKTLALEAARAAEAAAKAAAEAGLLGIGTDSNPEVKSSDIPNVLPTPGSSTSGSAPSTPPASGVPTQLPPSTQASNAQSVYSPLPPGGQQSSVITRMLQSQPVSSNSPQSFTAAAAAMGHKYFGAPNASGQMMAGPRTGYEMQPRGRIPSPYRQPGQTSMPPHFAAVRSGTPPMRMRVPGPQMYHTPHHPMDPSPSGGGPISISTRDRSSPLGPGPPAMIPPAAGSPLAKGGPTPPPPPPPYVRGGPPISRFADNPMGPRHQLPPFTNASPVNHAMQQPSPPPNRPPGNFSPYHPPPPPNYHYGAYPPPPPMSTADDAAAYQGSPYPTEHFSSPADNQPQIQAPPQPQPPQSQQPQQQPQPQTHPNDPTAVANKQYDEEGTGEFGGLVSYFSSQREDDLDS